VERACGRRPAHTLNRGVEIFLVIVHIFEKYAAFVKGNFLFVEYRTILLPTTYLSA
jgi:hypothetical protein